MRRSSAQGVLYGQTVANVAGIANSDLECMDILYLEGRVTAGRLAEVTGLTTGAITGVVDRLEKAGLVRRERDENDRRKVFIAVVPETAMKIGELYVPMQQAMEKVWSVERLFRRGAAFAAALRQRGLQGRAGGDRGAEGPDRYAAGEAPRSQAEEASWPYLIL